jgi:hypothetical protein
MTIGITGTEKEDRQIERRKKRPQERRAGLKMTQHHKEDADEFSDIDPFDPFLHTLFS